MSRLIWSPAALRDVARLHKLLKQKNPDAAARAAKAIRHGVRPLGTHPQAGRPAEDMPPEFREWPIDFGSSGYFVMYRYDGRDVVILAVRHDRGAGH